AVAHSAGQQLPALRADAQAQIDPLLVDIAQRLAPFLRNRIFANGGLPPQQQPQPPAAPQAPQQRGAPQVPVMQVAPQDFGLNSAPDFGQDQ
ncbi:MAG: hypothetical protein WC365_05755, partial [Candidatus Babeliales bacterium]